MVVLLILILSCLVFRGLGFAGISALGKWQTSARDALSLMLVFTGVSHFTFMKEDFVRMIPPSIPWPRAMVHFTGVCELAGAVGLLLPDFRRELPQAHAQIPKKLTHKLPPSAEKELILPGHGFPRKPCQIRREKLGVVVSPQRKIEKWSNLIVGC